MSQIPIPIVIVLTLFSGIALILGLLAYWKNSLIKRGIDLSIRQMCAMSVKKTLTEDMLSALELANKHQFIVKPHYLEAHAIAGGNPLHLIQIIVDGKGNNENISFREAATMDLGGVSLDETRKLYADHESNKNINSNND